MVSTDALSAKAATLSEVLIVARSAEAAAVLPQDVDDVQSMIDALPTVEALASMSLDEQAAVYDQVQDTYDAYTALTAEQQAQISGAEKFDALFAVFNSMVSALAKVSNVTYLDENGEQQTVASATIIDDSTSTTWANEWYVVNSDIAISSLITVNGNVDLILADGVTLTASAGINVSTGNSITIYCQSGGTGALRTTGGSSQAGIGGSWSAGGTVTINGGTVTAKGGFGAAGIGGGNGGAGGAITINGGTVMATGGEWGAGIGGGHSSAGGTITINGGTVTATGYITDSGSAAGIGGGTNGAGGNVTITGGTVTATGVGINGKGIGSGSSSPSNGNCSISGSAVVFAYSNGSVPIGNTGGSNNWNGIVFQGNSGQVYGDVTLKNDLEIPNGSTLTVPAGSTLTIPEGVTVTGGISTESGGTVNNSGTVTGEITGDGTVNVPSTVTVTVTPSSATYGDSVTLTATITNSSGGNVTGGTVTFYRGDVTTGTVLNSGGATVANGQATATVQLTGDNWTPDTYTITAVYGGGSGLLGNSGTAILTVNATPLDAPTGLAWSTVTPGQATWSAVTNASGYSVQLYNKDGSALGSPVTASGTSYDFTNTITQAGSYTFTVTAMGSGGYSNSSPSSQSTALHTVSFDTNDGIGTIPMQLVPNGDTATEPTAPTKTGYELGGWYSDSSFAEDGKWNFGTSTVTAATTLYAKWEAIDYDITVTVQGGTGNSASASVNSIPATSANMGDTVTLTAAPAEGYRFVKWQVTSGGVSISEQNTFTMPAGAVAVTAVFDPESYSVTLNANGGTITSGDVTKYTYGIGATLPAAEDMTYDGYVFKGWYESSDFSGEAVTAISVADTGNKTYYAKWTRLYTVTVTAESGGAVSGGGTFEDGSTVTVTAAADSGYRFVRWTENGRQVSGSANYAFTLTADRSLTAVFSRNSSGGGVVPTYPPTVDVGEGGSVDVLPSRPQKGQTVIVTPTPDEGQEVRDVTVTDADGNPVEVAENGDGTWSFTQPEGKVTIEVVFGCDGGDLCASHGFADVDPDAWYHDPIDWAVENGIMSGYSDTGLMGPDDTLTRAQLAAIVFNVEGAQPGDPSALEGFSDADPSAWYAGSLSWAVGSGLFSGYSGTSLMGPDAALTREQAAAVLMRWARMHGEDVSARADLSVYPDAGAVSPWAEECMSWAVATGVISGVDNPDGSKSLDPSGTATRAQAAALMMRLLAGGE